MAEASQDPWPAEQEYLYCLEHDRHMFAWTLHQFGAVPLDEAEQQALQCFPYEPPSDECRGLVFHDEAWHWAMLRLRGPMYWRVDPCLEVVPAEYRQEEDRFRVSRLRGPL